MLRSYHGRPDLAVARRTGSHHEAVGGLSRTPVPVFSVTKMFVATAALRLAESGLLDLDDAAARWVPLAPAGVTVRELLGHTGGLPDYAGTAEYLAAVDARPGQPWDLAAIVAVGLAGAHPARGRFHYSNLGYWLLGPVLEEVAGTSLGELLAASVFGPAGLTATVYPNPGDGVTATGYDTRWAGPAGAAWSTPTDLIAFLDAVFDRTLLSPASLAALTTPTPVDAGPPWRQPGYGLGIMIDSGTGTFGHGGGGPGYRSAVFGRPSLGRSAAVTAGTAADQDPIELVLRLLAADG